MFVIRTLLPKWSNLGDCGEDGADDAFFYQSSQGGRLILTDCNDKYHVRLALPVVSPCSCVFVRVCVCVCVCVWRVCLC